MVTSVSDAWAQNSAISTKVYKTGVALVTFLGKSLGTLFLEWIKVLFVSPITAVASWIKFLSNQIAGVVNGSCAAFSAFVETAMAAQG